MNGGIKQKRVKKIHFNKIKFLSICEKYRYLIYTLILIITEKVVFGFLNKFNGVHINYLIQILDGLANIIIIIYIVSSVSKKKNEPDKALIQLAYHDQLTGLHNRLSLLKYFQNLNISNKGGLGAIFFLDLDGFKGINDTFGHDVGDELLKVLSKELEQSVRENDLVCRYGGDEFVILFSKIKNKDSVIRIANKVIDIFQSPLTVKKYKINVTTSIGISIFPIDGIELDLLLKKSDKAMYMAKNEGKNRYKVYEVN